MIYNVTKLDAELKAAGIPIYGCASDGRIDFTPEATPEQQIEAEAIKATHDPTDTAGQARAAATAAVNGTDFTLIIADASTPNIAKLAQVVADLCVALGFTPKTD